MLRLALVATLMSSAMGLTYSGSMMTLYAIEETNVATSQAACADSGQTDGTAAGATGSTAANGPDFSQGTIWLQAAKPIFMDVCYELETEMLPTTSQFKAGVANSDVIFDEAGPVSVTQVKFSSAAAGVTMLPYTEAIVSGTQGACAGTAGTARVADETGYQCSDVAAAPLADGAITTGFALAANSDLGVVTGVNYVTVEKYSGHTGTAGGLCTGTADVTAGRNRELWPVIADELTAALAQANTGVVGSAPSIVRDKHLGFCYSNDYDANGDNVAPTSWNLVCSGTNGSIKYTEGVSADCDWANDDSGGDSVLFTKNDKCVGSASATTMFADTTSSWNIQNSDTEWEAICPTIGVAGGTTAAKYLKVYSTTTALARAAATLESAMTGAGVTGSRDIILGLCYTAQATGELTGFIGGPFGAGTADTEPAADKGSWMFAEDATVATEVEAFWYANSDCSGTGTTLDDGHDGTTGWAYEGFAAFDSSGALVTGTASAAGTTVTELVAATKYITVKRHTDAISTTGAAGTAGICLGGGTEVVGRVLDHFVLGNCHVHTGSATAANQVSYRWWCDTSDASIHYAEYAGEDCTGTLVTDSELEFTKTGKCICANCTGAAVTNDVSWEIRNDDTQWDAMCSVATSSSSSSEDDSSPASKIAATAAAAAAAAALLI